MTIEKNKITLKTGETAWAEYDREGDVLEIVFRQASATCAIELTESIILRFNWESNEPLSLSLVSFSHLLQPARYGEIHFQLLADEWPKEAKDKVWSMLQATPLSEFLKVGSYSPAHKNVFLPMATIKGAERFMQTAFHETEWQS